MDERPIKRLYYSIAEVSEITGVKPYVLRYWETEFPELTPQKNRSGNRAYKKNDIQLVFAIKRLLYDEKYTIEGARQRLRHVKDKKELAGQLTLLEDPKKDGILEDIRAGLLDCLKILETP